VSKLEFQNKVGERIKVLRTERGLSQRQLAIEAHKDPQSLERVENGKTIPGTYYLKQVCDALGITLEEFFKGVA
jgi:transcriptional regulator with XRE-family HTH domain